MFIEVSLTFTAMRLGVFIAKTFKHTCPYLSVQRHFAASAFSAHSEASIFCPLVFLRGTGAYKMRGSVPLCYTRAREIVLSAFDSTGLSKQDYGIHSVMAGSASDVRVPDRLFKRHGRWKSDKSKEGCMKDNVQSLLSVSLSLRI